MTPATISIIVFVAIAIIGLILFLVLRKKPKRDCQVKLFQAPTCSNGSYEIIYDISQSPQGDGVDCMTAMKQINSRMTYAPITGTTRYIGTGTCSDCVFKDISATDCSGNRQRLRLDVSSDAVDGNDCYTISKFKYNYDFKKDASGGYYYADISCSNRCDISEGSKRTGSCLGAYWRSRTEYEATDISRSTYGLTCTNLARKYINPKSWFDDTNNIVYYISNCDVSSYELQPTYLRYGYGSANSKFATYLTNTSVSLKLFKFYFNGTSSTSNLIGFDVMNSLDIGAFGTPIGVKTFQDISSSGRYITVGADAKYYTNNMVMTFPINIYSKDYIIKIEVEQNGTALTSMPYTTTGVVKIKLTTSLNIPDGQAAPTITADLTLTTT